MSKNIKLFDTINDLINDDSLIIGDYCKTLGFASINDGGSAEYIITAKTTNNDYLYVLTKSNLTAQYVIGENNKINVVSLGIIKEKDTAEVMSNNASILENYIVKYNSKRYSFYFPPGNFYFNPIHFLSAGKNTLDIFIEGTSAEFNSSNFKNTTTVYTKLQDFMYDQRYNNTGITFYVKNMNFISQGGYNFIPTGVCFGTEINTGSEYNFHFYSVLIHGFEYGFKSPGYSCGASGGENTSFSNCKYGVYITSASHLFSLKNSEFGYCANGIRFGFGGTPCEISNIHIAVGYLGSDKNEISEYKVIHCKGNVVIKNLYYEAYESTANPERTTIIDYEGWAYGVGPIYVYNTPIGKPSGKGGKFFKGRTYLGSGPEVNKATAPIKIDSWNKSYYPMGAAHFINCNLPSNKFDMLKAVFDIDDISKGFGYTINGETFYNYGVAIGLNKSKKFSSTMSRPLTTKNNGMLIAYDYNNINNRTFNNITFPNNPTMENEFLFFIRYKGKIIINKLSDNNTKISLGIIGLYNFSNYAIAYKIGEIDTSNGDQNKYIVMPFDIMLTKTSTFNTYTFGYEINGTTDNDLKSIDINKITWEIEVTQDNFS